jgi:mannose-6-phosphate isomerase-like protein (cupin superfamily)
MRAFLFSTTLLLANCVYSQTVSCDTIGNTTETKNVYSYRISGDSLCTSFCIIIKTEVKAHKHAFHSEQVIVMDGEGLMTLNEKSFRIKKGDVVFIPKNTVHAVNNKGKTPLKVVSVQSPLFDGKDRIMIEN